MKRCISVLLAMAILVSIGTTSAARPDGSPERYWYSVLANRLNIREDIGTENPRIDQVKCGTYLMSDGAYGYDNAGSEWLHVRCQYSDGWGWVCAEYVHFETIYTDRWNAGEL